MRCLCRHGTDRHIGLWCLECDDGYACCPPPQDVDEGPPGDPMPPVRRDGQRWDHRRRPIPPRYDEE